MIGLAVEMLAVGVDKIPGSEDVGLQDGRYLVTALKAANEYGDGHTLALYSDAVQTVAIEHLDLISAVAIVLPSDTVPGVPFVMNLYLW